MPNPFLSSSQPAMTTERRASEFLKNTGVLHVTVFRSVVLEVTRGAGRLAPGNHHDHLIFEENRTNVGLVRRSVGRVGTLERNVEGMRRGNGGVSPYFQTDSTFSACVARAYSCYLVNHTAVLQ
jgi:hypothetical protein